WTYARLPFDIAQLGGFRVEAFAAQEGEGDLGYVAGRPLGQVGHGWSQQTFASSGFIGVVGLNPGGLAGYQQQEPGTDSNPLGHEGTRLIPLRPEALPDRWLGLAMLRELVWNGVSPNELRIEQVRALREWVERGGHLVVVLPAVGQDWLAISNQELATMLPVVSVERLESVPLASLRPLLTDATPEELTLSETPVTLHAFEPMAEAEPGEADRILVDPEGRCIVVTRNLGIGATTLVGLPAWHQALARSQLPEADVFWHRVLGRRGHIATQSEFEAKRTAESMDFRPGGRPQVRLDGDISDQIAKSGRSLAGVMLGLVVFIVYWIVAGPGAYAVLRHKSKTQHAWLAFLGASLAFTALAWGGATLLRPKRVEISHLSFLDHVYGQRVQRVKTWASVLVPVYGDATVALQSDDAGAGGSRFVQAVAPWESPPSIGLGGRGAFPDARAYQIDSRAPDSLTFPARATVKQVQLDWAGGLAWESISPVLGEGDDPFTAVRFTRDGDAAALEGALVHNLPGTLEHVHVIVFRQQAPVRASLAKGALLTSANSWSPGDWAPGQPLDLHAVTMQAADTGVGKMLTALGRLKSGTDGLPTGTGAAEADRFEWLAFFNLFDGPNYLDTRGSMEGPPLQRREATHALDLSRWATRPCLVVLATLRTAGEDSLPAPIQVSTNGGLRRPYCSGTTVVRWVYPLPPNPPEVQPETLPADATDPDAGGD
ncbi:MAG TPA: hypothetical protein VFF69_03125, partial [Phycisphaerales bacterium]|nr:hypothetical protein [Phycisphaerales bacterium]